MNRFANWIGDIADYLGTKFQEKGKTYPEVWNENFSHSGPIFIEATNETGHIDLETGEYVMDSYIENFQEIARPKG